MWFDVRYRDSNFNSGVKSMSDDKKRKNGKKRKGINKGSGKRQTESPPRRMISRLNGTNNNIGELLSLKYRKPGALSRTAEEVVSSLQKLFLTGYNEDEAVRTLVLSQIEISDYLLVIK